MYSGILISLASGLTGLFLYSTFIIAFLVGTEQVAANADKTTLQLIACFFQNCGISGAEVMACIYDVVLSAAFFGLLAPGINADNLGLQTAADIFATIDRKPAIDSS